MGDNYELCHNDFIKIANKLGDSEFAPACTQILFTLYENSELNQGEIIKYSSLSIANCREALIYLRGALFVDAETHWKSTIYHLTSNGYKLAETLKKNNERKGSEHA